MCVLNLGFSNQNCKDSTAIKELHILWISPDCWPLYLSGISFMNIDCPASEVFESVVEGHKAHLGRSSLSHFLAVALLIVAYPFQPELY